MMFSPLVSRAALVLALAAAAPATAQEQLILAQGLVDEVGGAERIDRAGYLRTLTQRIPAAACNEAAGVADATARQTLFDDKLAFDTILNALSKGDDSLGIIGAETDRRVLKAISELQNIWSFSGTEIRAMMDGDVSLDHVEAIAGKSGALLEAAKDAVAQISAEYADPTALVQADAIVIDIAGRQRLLPQIISKNTCLIASGVLVDSAKAELISSIEMYEVSLQALRFGMAAAGISSPPSQEVRDHLDRIAADWEALKPTVVSVLEGQTVSIDERARVFEGANSLTAKMNAVVGMYAEASKLGL